MTATRTTFQQVAEEFAGAFETATRDNGDSYTRLKDEYRGTWAQEIVFKAHADMFPDDWKYACIAAAAETIAEYEDEDDAQDARGEFADNQVDVYNSDRLEWIGSHGYRPGYCDEAAREFGYDPSEPRDILDQIALGQYYEADEVYGLTLQALAEVAAMR